MKQATDGGKAALIERILRAMQEEGEEEGEEEEGEEEESEEEYWGQSRGTEVEAEGAAAEPVPEAWGDELPAPWSEVEADDGRVYYWNEDTGETSWTRPAPARPPPPRALPPPPEQKRISVPLPPRRAGPGEAPVSQHPHLGRIRQARPAPIMGGTPLRIAGPAPLLGEHTAEILRELGYTPQQVAAMRAGGALAKED